MLLLLMRRVDRVVRPGTGGGFISWIEGVASATGVDKVVKTATGKTTGGARLVHEDGRVTATAFVEDVAHHHVVDELVHEFTGGKRVLNRDGSLAHMWAIKVNVVKFLEDIANETGFDRVVHKVTGGKRVMDRNGCVNKEFLSELEKACEETGFSNIVHTATGGSRMVRPDGTFDAEGMIRVAANVAALVADTSDTVATARVAGQVQKKMIEQFMNLASELSQEGVDAARIVKSLHDALNGMMTTVQTLIEGPVNPAAFATALLDFKDIPKRLKEIEDGLQKLQN